MGIFEGSSKKNSDDRINKDDTNVHKFIALVCTFVLTRQRIFRVPDRSNGVMFKFIEVNLNQISKITSSNTMQQICDLFPTTLSNARKMLAIDIKKQHCLSFHLYILFMHTFSASTAKNVHKKPGATGKNS